MFKSQASVDVAIYLLRPGVKRYEISGTTFNIWDDPRPQPSWDEIIETVEKIKSFENSITPIFLEEDLLKE